MYLHNIRDERSKWGWLLWTSDLEVSEHPLSCTGRVPTPRGARAVGGGRLVFSHYPCRRRSVEHGVTYLWSWSLGLFVWEMC